MNNKALFFVITAIFLILANFSAASNNNKKIINKSLNMENRYVIIINGDTSRLHLGNVERFYQTVLNLGYIDQNIYILSPYPVAKRSEAGKFNHLKATYHNIKIFFHSLKNILNKDHEVLIYVTGHGERLKTKKKSGVALEKNYILEQSQFSNFVNNLSFSQLILVMDTCYSGGMVEAMTLNSNKNIIAFSATDSTHTTYCKFFAWAFTKSFYDQRADQNADGFISAREAYNYSSAFHKVILKSRKAETNTLYTFSGDNKDTLIGKLIKKQSDIKQISAKK